MNILVLTFDFSSSSKMAFLGLGGGRFSSLSGGSSGSCLIIPDLQNTECEQDKKSDASKSLKTPLEVVSIHLEAEASYLVSSASDRHLRFWSHQVTPKSSYRSTPKPSFLLALVTASPGTEWENKNENNRVSHTLAQRFQTLWGKNRHTEGFTFGETTLMSSLRKRNLPTSL